MTRATHATRTAERCPEIHDEPATMELPGLVTRASASPRSRIRRHPERSVPEIAEEILRVGLVAHVAFAVDGQPYVVPMTYHYEDGVIYLHGAPASRLQQTLRAGAQVAVEVTLLDGLVASRDAKNHSVNYRSVVVYGTAEPVTGMKRKRALMEAMTRRYFPGWTVGRDYDPATTGHLRALEVMAVAIEELSAKARSGPPRGARDALDDAPGSAFVLVLPGLNS
ncbi:MAG TPA: pyridoxamine 5'-phosphate oxidase family protein [Ktedonobacterales bacterium]|nr:pyridoxamine 5'-phosphate oxidase family protein [Ktedonobacterales bacterium]